MALNRQLKDQTGGALYFHHRGVSPDWSKEYIRAVEIGEFAFYKPAGGLAKWALPVDIGGSFEKLFFTKS